MKDSKQEGIAEVPLIEVIKGVFQFVNNPLPVINDALIKYGETYVTRIVGGKRLIMTVDPKVIQYVLQGNQKNYIKSAIQTESLGRYVGQGLLTVNGPYWMQQRRLIQPGFHKARIEGLISIVAMETERFCDELELRVGSNPAVDVGDTMMELTLRIVSKALFSSGINKDTIEDIGEKFVSLQEHIIKEVRQPQLNWWRKLNGKRANALNQSESIRDLMRSMIRDRESGESQPTNDLLEMLMEARYEDTGEGMSDKQLIDEAIILFVAGHETTANAMTWCLYLLARHPAICHELKSQIGQEERQWTMAQIAENDFLQAVLLETMRLYPPAWILDREALEDDQIDNVKIKKGDLFGLYAYGAHRNEVHWERPDEFNPSRFLDIDANKQRAKYSYFPFGGGPRLCIGQQFAMMEMKIALFSLIQRFDWGYRNDAVSPLPIITLRPKEVILMDVTSKR